MPSNYIKCIGKYLNTIAKIDPIATDMVSKLNPKIPIKTIIFDIYGTLLVSASGDLDQATMLEQHVNIALQASGFTWKNADSKKHATQLLDIFRNKIREQQENLREQGFLYPEVDIVKVWGACFAQAQKSGWFLTSQHADVKLYAVIFELLSNTVWPMPNLYNLFRSLQKKAIPMGIVSNAQFYTPIIMNYFLHDKIVADEFVQGFDKDLSVFSYQLKRSKPDVFLFNKLAKHLKSKYDIKPEQALFVGNDMLKDIWTASQVGFKTALFAADKRSLRMRANDNRVKQVHPDYIITDLLQLLTLV